MFDNDMDSEYETQVMDERQEIEAKRMFRKLLRDIGAEAYNKFLVELAQEHEEMLRAQFPNHPILKFLDEDRERQLLGLN